MASKPVKIIVAYLSPFLPLVGTDLPACFGEGMPALLADNLNNKDVDSNSRLSTRRWKLLRDYADGISCLIVGPNSPTNNPYNPLGTPDVLDIVITKIFTSPPYLTLCSAVSYDQLPVLIDTTCRSSFQDPPDRNDFRRTDWVNFQIYLEDQIPFDPELHDGLAIDTCVVNFSDAVLKALVASTAKRRQRADPWPPIPAGIQDEIASRIYCGDSGRSPGIPL